MREQLPYVVILDGQHASTSNILSCIEVQVPVVIVLSAAGVQWPEVSARQSSFHLATEVSSRLKQNYLHKASPASSDLVLPV